MFGTLFGIDIVFLCCVAFMVLAIIEAGICVMEAKVLWAQRKRRKVVQVAKRQLNPQPPKKRTFSDIKR